MDTSVFIHALAYGSMERLRIPLPMFGVLFEKKPPIPTVPAFLKY